MGISERDRPHLEASFARWFGEASQQGQSETVLDLVGRADAGVEGLPEECEPDPEHEAERCAEKHVSNGLRLDLASLVGGDHIGVLRLERLGRTEEGNLVEEALVEGGVVLAGGLELHKPTLGFAARLDDRIGLEFLAIGRIRARVRGSQPFRSRGIAVANCEREQIGVGARGDRRCIERLLCGHPREPASSDGSLRDRASARQAGLCLREPSRVSL